ncbi:MAG: alpha-galactosidase [Isosphaeraceae bacterium]
MCHRRCHHRTPSSWIALGLLLVIGPVRAATSPTPAEKDLASEWIRTHLLDAKPRLPFSFVYSGKPSGELLQGWPRTTADRQVDASRTEHEIMWQETGGGLAVACRAVVFADFPVVEWTVSLRNTAGAKSPVLEQIQGIDVTLTRDSIGEFRLHGCKGDTFAADLYEPFEKPLGPGALERFAPVGGRGSNGAFPYYNLAMPGGGLIMAIGWPGQWASEFARDSSRGLHIRAGQELTRLSLLPGESVRTPLIALMFWRGEDVARSHNLWRRWMWAHQVPRDRDGAPPALLLGNTSLEFNEMCNATRENQIAFIDRYLEEKIPISFWWMDAGWYPCDGQWPRTGTWEPDLKRFPGGLRAITDHARTRRIRSLVWFEPERVAQGTWLASHHPEWLLGGTLLDLGKAEARNWLTGHVDRVLRDQGIDLYRQDFNMDPLDFWRKHDPQDRQGATENHHVQGYLAYWDALRDRHPRLIIDSCASGGRRNDLETMGRAIALHPTDYNYADLAAKQAFHASLFRWLPCFGSNTNPVDTVDPYAFRSGHAPNMVLGYDMRRKDLDYRSLRRLAEEWRTIVPYYLGDYYALTPYSRDEAKWLAWQFDRPESGDGLVEAFRRPQASEPSIQVPLRGLDPATAYEVIELDSGRSSRHPGKDLVERGLPIEVRSMPGAVAILYRQAR